MQHGTLYCGSPNQHTTVTLLSAIGTDINPTISLSVFSWITFILRWRSHNGLFLPLSVLLTFMAFSPLSPSSRHSLWSCSSSLTKCHLPNNKLLFWLHFSSKSGMQGSVFKDLFNQHMPTILWFFRHLLLLANHLTVSIFPRNSAEATSVLQHLPKLMKPAHLLTCTNCSISIQSHVTE